MKITIFGATGSLGKECLRCAIEDNHEITILVRNKEKIEFQLRKNITIVEGDALNIEAVEKVIDEKTEAILFAIGIKSGSPSNLCTLITKNIIDVMNTKSVKKFIFCSGASTLTSMDKITFGMRFVEFYARVFMPKKHYDKENQLNMLYTQENIQWMGIRPGKMINKSRKQNYKIGYIKFNAFSTISYFDCAKEMLKMINNDKWIHGLPIIHY